MNNEEFIEAEVELSLEQQLKNIEPKSDNEEDKSNYTNKKRKPGRPKATEIVLKPIKRDKPGRPPSLKTVEKEGAPKNMVGRPATRHLPSQNQLINYRQKVYNDILSILNQDLDNEERLELIAREFTGSDSYFEKRNITLEQCVFLSIFEHNLCNEYEALKLSGIETIRTLYNWKMNNEHFLAAYNYLLKDRIKLVEQTLFADAINNKNPASCMFLLKKLDRERYGDNDNTTKDTQIVGTNLVVAKNNN